MKPLYIIALIIQLIVLSIAQAQANAAQPIDAKKLFNNASMSMVKLSPNGKYLLVHQKLENTHAISLFNIATHKFTSSVSIGNDNTLHNYWWLNDNQFFISTTYDNKDLALIANIKNNVIKTQLIPQSGYLVHALPEYKNKVLFAKRNNNHAYWYTVYAIDIDDLILGEFENGYKVHKTGVRVESYVYDNTLKRLLALEFDHQSESLAIRLMPINGASWSKALILEKTDYHFSIIGFLEPDTLLVLTNKDTDKVVLRKFNVITKQLGDIVYQHPDYDLISADITNKQLASVSYREHGLTQRVFFSPQQADFQQRLKSTFNNHDSHIIGTSDDGSVNLLYVNGSTQPGEYFIYNSKNDKAHRLFTSFYDLENYRFSQSKTFSVITEDNENIEAFLNMPVGIDLSTLLVMPHGGPIGVQETDVFNKQVQYFTSRGFAVLRINFRGSSGFGKAFSDRGVGEFGKKIERDISAVVSHVGQQYQFKNRCSIGASYGGYSAVMLAIKHPDLYDCVVASFGIYDLQLLFNASNYRSGEEYSQFIAKTVGEFSLNMLDVSPVYLTKQFKTPLLLIAGKEDDVADFEHSNRFKYLLEQQNHDIETVFYENTGHGHNYWQWDRHEMAITYDYLLRKLKLEPPKLETLSQDAQQAIANDFSEIADGYSFDQNLAKNDQKAYQYYLKAAHYQHPRATFNVGSYAHRGDVVKQSDEKAIEFYKKAAKLDYSGAHARLSRLHIEGQLLENDWQKAFIHIQTALELDDSYRNKIALARFYCLAPSPYKDIDQCLSLMELEQYRDISKETLNKAFDAINEVLAWTFARAKLSANELQKLRQFTTKTFKLDNHLADLEHIQTGHFVLKKAEKFSQENEYKLYKSQGVLHFKNIEDDRFGAVFETDIPGIDSYKQRVAIVSHWSVIRANGTIEYPQSVVLHGSPRDIWYSMQPFENIKEGDKWVVELYNLEQQRLLKREFDVSPTN